MSERTVQILERWTVDASYLSDAGLGVEIGVFDGNAPQDWLDVGNLENFGNSWSGRLSWKALTMLGRMEGGPPGTEARMDAAGPGGVHVTRSGRRTFSG